MQYKLCEWEINGYSDSDWIVVVYDDETDELKDICYDTTRFGHGPEYKGLSAYAMPTKEIVERARSIFALMIYSKLKEENINEVLKPNTIDIGDRVKLLEDHKNQKKDFDLVNCLKCSGSGHWVNPRNSNDKRECFACKGEGKVKANFRKVKADNGKLEWDKFEKGITGKVIWTGTYRTIYRNGYNKLDRETLETKVLLDDGREMKCPLSKLGLDQELKSHIELLNKAREYSYTYSFGNIFPKFTWESYNWARDIATKED